MSNKYLVNWLHHPSGKQGTTEHETESYHELCRLLNEWNRSNPSVWQYWYLSKPRAATEPFVKSIQDALQTGEIDGALVEVARAASKAERELAAISDIPYPKDAREFVCKVALMDAVHIEEAFDLIQSEARKLCGMEEGN